ncbi:hypothetical protein B0T10DRAFT_499537 [Thelonectria olida]|uniref:Uncharacterized protein n=1 Tax=Thelonectria olida TaxID=1576542 RepID=A0A9P8VSL2_9HYPO|nr:hypothetical protein B0T10DRAFT_499537 [Thelonectria olida]
MDPEISRKPPGYSQAPSGRAYVDYSEVPTGPHTGTGSQAFARSPSQSSEPGSRFQSPFTPSSPVFRSRHDSQLNPLVNANRTNHKAGSAVGQKTANHDHWWKTVFKSKWAMVICLVIGLAGAIGHHFLYWSLDGREAKDQQWWLRLGQFISFTAKAAFVLALLMAHQQAAWRVVGQKTYSVNAVDSLFGAPHDAVELFNKEAWQKSWLVMFLAIYVWASPLVVIFSSATLNVVAETKHQETTCPSIRTLNFSHDETNDFRKVNIPAGQDLRSLSFSLWNTTSEDVNDANHFDYWTKFSEPLAAISAKVLYGKEAIAREDVALEVCGAGWNCSTTINFVAPGYKCQELASGMNSTLKNLGNVKAPFNMSTLVPLGNYTYYAVADEGEYAEQQIESGDAGIPIHSPPFPKNLGAFRTEPVIWLGYASVDNLTESHPGDRTAPGWYDAYKPVVFACEHYETNYTVSLNYTGGIQTYEVKKRDYMHKIIDTTFLRGEDSDDGTLDKTMAMPAENYIFPQDVRRYRRTAAYHALGKQLRDLINGDIKIPGTITESRIIRSRLLDRHEWLPVHELQNQVRKIYEDIIISLFSDPQMIAVSWASDPSRPSGVGMGGAKTKYPCLREQTANFFFYQWEVLLTVYAVTFIIASVGVVSGFLAMHKEGLEEQRVMTFSSMAESTNGVRIVKTEDSDTMIKYCQVDDLSGQRVHRFEKEHGEQMSSRSDLRDKVRSSVRESEA